MELLWKIVSAIILALVEGITEFLPVSSTVHMILVRELLDLDVPPGGVFEVFIQFGAILSICLIYFDYLWNVTKAVPFNENARRFAFGLFIAFLPAAILGVLLSDFITTYLFSKYVVAVSLVVGGFAILYIERLVKIPQYYSVKEFPLSLYLKIGVCQCVAKITGVSLVKEGEQVDRQGTAPPYNDDCAASEPSPRARPESSFLPRLRAYRRRNATS